MKEKELLFFAPEFKTLIWGGSKMRDVFNYDIPAENTGECWAISAHPNGDCTCINGADKGKKLSWLWENRPELFGRMGLDRFPLLLKVIDAKDDLSIQVHPSDEYAKVHENGSLGKTECWYILDCEKDSKLVIGHKAKTKEELCRLIDEHKFNELISEVPVKPGDFIQIDPGTIHAIKGGVMILETQQNSDITYRVYDYDRLQNGKPRALHVEQSKAVVSVPAKDGAVFATSCKAGIEKLVTCKYYSVSKINVSGNCSLNQDKSFMMMSVIDGKGTVCGTEIRKGDHFIVPFEFGKVELKGDMTLIVSNPE